MGSNIIDSDNLLERTLDAESLNSQKYISLSKHDAFVELLNEEIKDYYDRTIFHYPLISRTKTNRRTTKGEIDLLCFKGNTLHAYEVKCSNRVTKAKHQLRKIRKNLFKEFSYIKEVKTFFYCGESGCIHLIPEF